MNEDEKLAQKLIDNFGTILDSKQREFSDIYQLDWIEAIHLIRKEAWKTIDQVLPPTGTICLLQLSDPQIRVIATKYKNFWGNLNNKYDNNNVIYWMVLPVSPTT